MSRIRLIYIASLVILGALLVSTVFIPVASGEKFSEVTREAIIQREEHYIIQFNIDNREGKDTSYIMSWSTGGETYNSKKISIKNGKTFTNIHHIYPETVKEGQIQLTIYKEGEDAPFEESTYYIRFD